MRLLTVSDNDELSLVERVGNDIPPYAILSHTWGADSDEISYRDLVDGRYKEKKGFVKLDFCRKQVAIDDLKYFWVDTCCIDKSSSAELTEAINSMFRWYQGAARCYVFLSDVTVVTDLTGSPVGAISQALGGSRWFGRGWTLQELIAPTLVDFFDANGTHLGNKRSLFSAIHEITKLPLEVVRGKSLSDFSVDVRLSWAEGRETKREEDAAYSLLGILDVYMPLIYGEGRQRAFRRLLKELSELEKPSSWSTQPAIQNLQIGQNLKSQAPQAISSSTKTSVLEKYNPVHTSSQKGTIALMPMWPGNCIRTTHSSKYVKQRNAISDAAKTGRWSEVLELLDLAREDYGENWSNVVRMRPPHEANRLSFWTLLHQAAYVRVPKNIVKQLLDRGSLRTVRTRKTDSHFSHQDITAADIARDSKHADLADMLAPVIYHSVPPQTLARLESQFHEMIKADLGERAAHLVLPDLVALTELKVPEMWFPVGEQGESKKPVGYVYKLEERMLVVTKLGLGGEAPQMYKIK